MLPTLILHPRRNHRQQITMVVVALVMSFLPSVKAGAPPRTRDTPSRPYLPYHHHNNSSVTRNYNIITNDVADDVVSCGSCCYQIVDAKSPLDLTFYTKMINLNGFFIGSSSEVRDTALYEAALTVATMSEERPDLLQLLVDEQVVLAVIGKDQVTRDIPDYANLDPEWDIYRGLGATQYRPTTSCAEENLLCLTDDVYRGENICIHETAHSLAGSGGKLPSPRFMNGTDLDQLLRDIYTASVNKKGLWSRTYASTNHEELWAEGVQSYYGVNYLGPVGGDGIHNDINTRSKLQSYDPSLYAVAKNIFGTRSTRAFKCPTTTCNCTTFVCPLQKLSPTRRPTRKRTTTRTPTKKSTPTRTPTKKPTPTRTPTKKPTPTRTPTKKLPSLLRRPTKKPSLTG